MIFRTSGTTVINPAVMLMDVDIITVDDVDGDGFPDIISLIDDGNAYNWELDAMQAKVPYMYYIADSQDWDSVLKIVNEYNEAADIRVDVIIEDRVDGGCIYQANVDFGTVDALCSATFDGADFVDKFGLDSSKSYHFAMTVTVIAAADKVFAIAQHKSDTGRANAPVLYMTGKHKWFQ